MSFSPNDIPISITGSQTPVLHSEIPQGLSDYANPTVTDPKVAANFLFQNILLTNPGEKLSDPNFGVGLRSFLFEPQNSFYNLESIIGDQLSSYALGIQVLNVAVDLSGISECNTGVCFNKIFKSK